MQKNTESLKYGYVDALRGYAVLLVILGHVAQASPLPGLLSNLPKYGAFGVQLFYVVSAFTLAMSWQARQDGVTNFYIRRFFRIAPLFWIAVMFYTTFYGLSDRGFGLSDITWKEILLTITFTHMISPNSINSVVPGGWSVAVEMCFYAIFPFMIALIRGWRSGFIVTILLYVIGKYVSAALFKLMTGPEYQEDILQAWRYYILSSQISAFTIGLTLFHLVKAFQRQLTGTTSTCLFLGAVLVSWAIIENLQYGGPIAVLLYSSVFASFTLSLSSGFLTFVTSKWIRQLGVLSYSAYLSHFGVVHLVMTLGLNETTNELNSYFRFFMVSATVVSGTVLISYLTHRFIETPGIKMGNSFISNRIKSQPALRGD